MNNSSDTLDKIISSICKNEYMYFFKKSNVTGVALGYKRKNGFYTCEKCITVFVLQKVPSNNLNSNDLIPMHYNGIKTDVVQNSTFEMQSLNTKIRPVLGGYCIGNESQPEGGSLGCLVTDGHNKYILSNNHVIANENKAPLGSRILQPSIAFGGDPNKDSIATLSKFIPLKPKTFLLNPSNYVDCAIGKITLSSLISSSIALVGKPKSMVTPKLHQEVKKVGKTTDLTVGIILNLSGTIVVNSDSKKYTFKNQIIASNMSRHGDSGSLVLDEQNHAIGLLMSSTAETTAINPINEVLKNLNVELVTN